MGKSSQWHQQEDEIILKEFSIHKSRKWKHISGKLSDYGFQKTQAECRQRYVNHLDPKLSKQREISQEQLRIIYEKYQEYGPKWCMIQTFIPQRTQIRIKNIFYGNIRLFLKKMYKFFSKKTAVFINQLKTQDLQAVYEGIEQFYGLNMIRKDFKRFNYRINGQSSILMIKQNQRKYLELINRIISFKTKLAPIPGKQKKVNSQKIDLNKQSFGKVDPSIKDQIKIIQKQQEQKSKIQPNNCDISKLIKEQAPKLQYSYFPFYRFSQKHPLSETTLLNLVPFIKYGSFDEQQNQYSVFCNQNNINGLTYQNGYNQFFYSPQAPFQISNGLNMFSNCPIRREIEQQCVAIIGEGEKMADE